MTDRKTIKLLGGAAVLVLVAAVSFLTVLPLVNASTTHSSELSDAETALNGSKERLGKIVATQEQSEAIQEINTTLANRFPDLQYGSDLLNSLSTAASASGLSATNISSVTISPPVLIEPPVAEEPEASEEASEENPEPSEDAGSSAAGAEAPVENQEQLIASMDINMTVKGQDGQLSAFLANMGNMKRVIVVNTFTYSAGAEEEDSSITITGKAYLYAPITLDVKESNEGEGSDSETTPGETTGTEPVDPTGEQPVG